MLGHKCLVMFAVILAGAFVPASAQEVKIVRNSDKPDEWTVSYSRKFDPDGFELDSVQKSEAEANKRVAALRAWSAHMEPADTTWKLAVILVEVGRPGASSDSPTDEKSTDAPDVTLPKLKLLPNSKPGDVLNEYRKVVQPAYANAKEARRSLLATTSRLQEQAFRAANQTIANFNSLRAEAVSKTGDAFKSTPEVALVRDDEMRVPISRMIQMPKVKWEDVPSPVFSKYKPDVGAVNLVEDTTKRDVPSAAGKQGRGDFGKTKVTIDFDKDGTFKVNDVADKQIASGKWIQSGSELHFASESFVYIGNVGDKKAKGIRFPRQQEKRLGSAEEEWNLSWQPPLTASGTYTIQTTFVINEFRLSKDGTGTLARNSTVSKDKWKYPLTWTQSGNTITITVDEASVFSGDWTLTKTGIRNKDGVDYQKK